MAESKYLGQVYDEASSSGLLRASPIIENAAYLLQTDTDGSLMDGAYGNKCQSRSRSSRSPGISGRPSSIDTKVE